MGMSNPFIVAQSEVSFMGDFYSILIMMTAVLSQLINVQSARNVNGTCIH